MDGYSEFTKDPKPLTTINLQAHSERFKGFASQYHSFRPQPPSQLISLLLEFTSRLRQSTPLLGQVVDLGCGTGLSTLVWSQHARKVIGIEPSEDMIKQAISSAQHLGNVAFLPGYSHATNLDPNSTDLVTCSQCLHWMDPTTTFREVNRILKPGGLFAAYDYDLPMTVSGLQVELDHLLDSWLKKIDREAKDKGTMESVHKQNKDGHLQRMKDCGDFSFCGEALLNSREEHHLTLEELVERLIGFSLSLGQVQTALKAGVITENDINEQRDHIKKALIQQRPELSDKNTFVIYWFYRVRYAIK